MILYCSILLHSSLNCDQFTVLHANTCQFLIKNLKFKVLKITTYFSQYGHHRVLKCSGGSAAVLLLLHSRTKQAMKNKRERSPQSTTHVYIRGTHVTTAEQQQFPPLDFNT
jgi:hypothetical protein